MNEEQIEKAKVAVVTGAGRGIGFTMAKALSEYGAFVIGVDLDFPLEGYSLDHKMIAKQFLLTGMFMALVGMLMSAIFRVQLANPGESSILYNLLPS